MRENQRQIHRTSGVVRRDSFADFSENSAGLFSLENAKCQEYFGARTEICNVLSQEIRRRDNHDGHSLPVIFNGWLYYDSWSAGDDYVRHCRRSIAGGVEQLLLDENALARHKSYFDLADWGVDRKQCRIAWSVDTVGDESYRIFVKDLETREVLDMSPACCDAAFEWGADAGQIYYARVDDDGRVSSVLRHEIGQHWQGDEIVYEETDEAFATGVEKSRCHRWLLIETGSFSANETRLVDLSASPLNTKLIEPRIDGFEYFVDIYENQLLILASTGGEFELYRTTVDRLNVDQWQAVNLETEDWLLESVEGFAEYYVVTQRYGTRVRLLVLDYTDTEIARMSPQPGFDSVQLGENYFSNAPVLRVDRISAVNPEQTLLWELSDDSRRLLWEEDPGDDYDADNYATKRLFVRSHDGVVVPISLLWRRDQLSVGGSPCLLNVYGAYEDVVDLDFDSDRIGLLNRGVVFVTAHVRGGGELGREWYLQGRRQQKINSIIDLVVVARGLVEMGVAADRKIVLQTDSAGGLVVGAALNEEPDLFAGAVLDVPFVDMIGSLEDEDLPTTIADRDEFGDPSKVEEMRHIVRVSPFDNVRGTTLPPVFVCAGAEDERVPVREPLKWAARIRERSDSEILIYVDPEAGHHGPMGRSREIESLARKHAFILSCLDIKN